MDKVLVILATYNGERYLQEQLDSILGQKQVDVSILARDDGSRDGTQGILEKYAGSYKLKWYTGKHLNITKGYFDLMKRASLCNADYIAFADQDDVWDTDKLYVAVRHLKTVETNVPALYYCGQRLVDANRNLIGDHELNRNRSLTTRFVLSDFAGCTGVFNNALLQEVVKYEPEYMLMHDTWILKICLALGGTVLVDPECHMDYRQHGDNALGLDRNFWSYLKQVNLYINKYHVEKQMRELLSGYGDQILPEYRQLAEDICRYRTDWECRCRLLDRNYINFCSSGLNLTYWLKVMLNKL